MGECSLGLPYWNKDIIIIIITAMTKLTNEEKDDASMTEELRVCSTSDTIYMRAQL